MRGHNKNRNTRLPHQMLSNAADENMFESGEAVRRSNNQINILPQGKVADLLDRRSNHELGRELDPAELRAADEFSHLLLRIFCRRSRKPREAGRVEIHRLRIAEIQNVEHDDFRGELLRESNGVSKAIERSSSRNPLAPESCRSSSSGPAGSGPNGSGAADFRSTRTGQGEC